MIPKIQKIYTVANETNTIILVRGKDQLPKEKFSKEEIQFLQKQFDDNSETRLGHFNRFDFQLFIVDVSNKHCDHLLMEDFRKAGNELLTLMKKFKIQEATLEDYTNENNAALAFCEGMVLGSYSFEKYKTKKSEHNLESVFLFSDKATEEEIEQLNIVCEATAICRDWVNEPQSYLDAEKFSEELTQMAESCGASIEVLNKRKIESLKMGGLLAVNKGSLTPPNFNILEWKPENAINKKPFIFVGKGIVYDTGGLNIKTGDFMNDMKMDMAGGAAAATALFAVAKAKLPVYLIAMIPVTDNRPSGNAYTSGDVISMYNGKTVEVLNTDAEGRLILADALSYASKFEPEFVIDLATLTGAAARAIGKPAMVGMRKDAADVFAKLTECGNNVYERCVEFPMWEEYGEMIKSTVADIKNLGGVEAGAITAGKFLEHFVDYPWIHLDIAGPAFGSSRDSYRGQGATGWGTRVLFELVRNLNSDLEK